MAKNHKKLNPEQSAKLLTAQNRKLFFRKFERIVTLISGNSNTIKLIPPDILENYYTYRYQAVKVEAAYGQLIEPSVLKELKEAVTRNLRKTTTPINEKGDTITLEDFLSVGLTLILQTDKIAPILKKTAGPFVDLLKSLLDKQKDPESAWHNTGRIIGMIGIFKSNISTSLYSTDIKNVQLVPKFYISTKVSSYIQEKIYISIDGISRAIIRVGWCFDPQGVRWGKCSPSLFGLPVSECSAMLPVYIQTHAIQRLEERLDCVHTNLASYYIYDAVFDGKIIKGLNNSFLIEYKFNEKKAGYLLAGIYEDKVVIRTFLFLTNNGTPEGKKLHELAGLQKQDKKYLLFDKLSTFMNPDLRRNETLRRLFFDAGCGDLFELAEEETFGDEIDYKNLNVESMMDYLMLKPVDAEAPPDFSDALANGRYS